MSLDKTIEDIRSLKIQGANSVAYHAVLALKDICHMAKTITELKSGLEAAKKRLFSARPTEPALRNAINYVIKNSHGQDLRQFRSSALKLVADAAGALKGSNEAIARIGYRKIRSGMTIFTHCHSSSVLAVIRRAWKEGARFNVHNTETRPRFQGRITARELASIGIPVRHFVDAAARLAIKKADLMLIGADAITTEGYVINKIGSELMSEVAARYGVPVYSCASSWKFDPETIFGFDEVIESRSPKEVWERPPRGVKIDNHAFEKVSPGLIAGIISETGIYPSEVFVEEMKKKNSWMF